MNRTGKHTTAALTRSRGLAVPPSSDASTPTDDSGFTMIEAVVSFTIFAIVIAAAVTAIVAGASTANGNRDRVTAANLAQQALNNAQAVPNASLTAAPTATSTSTVGSEAYTVVRTLGFAQASASATATSAAAGCPTAVAAGSAPAVWMHIAVTVTWPGSNGRSVQMDSVRSC